MNFTWPSEQVKTSIDSIRNVIGRDVQINVKVTGSGCHYCSEDPITHMSTDSFCIYCSGIHWLNTSSGYTVNAHVRWTKLDVPSWQTGGQLPKGDCIVTMEYTANNLSNVQNAYNFIIDDQTMQMNGYVQKGVPTPNRIKVILKEINN